MGKHLAYFFCCFAAVVALASPASAEGSVVASEAGNMLPLPYDFGFSPTRLSRTEPTPGTLQIGGHYATEDGSHPPALRKLRLQLDRDFDFQAKKVPACSPSSLDDRIPDLEAACRTSIVGRGSLSVEILYMDATPISLTVPLIVFGDGGGRSGPNFAIYGVIGVPSPTVLFIPMEVRRRPGARYGWSASIEIPKIAAGVGSITDFRFRIGKRVVTATCPDGKLQTRGSALFADGQRITGSVVRA